MVKLGVLTKTDEITPAASPMVVVKQKGKIRVCIDPTDINKNIHRRYHPLKTIDEITANIKKSKWFTLLDCKKGFWQIEVTDRTRKYLTMATPWGRYSYQRLPFGLASAPEVYQQLMSQLLENLQNTEVSMDDILIHAETKEQLEKQTEAVIKILKDAGLKLNKDKCVFNVNKVKFLGHILTSHGIEADQDKIMAINQLKRPENKTQLQRILGMATYLCKFIQNFSELTAPLRSLLKKDVLWIWSPKHETSFKNLKTAFSSTPVLRYFDPNLDVKLQVDASKSSLGAALLQNDQPVAYASKSLSKAEQNYAQIEKEATAIRFACEKFHEYIYGKKLIIETDHKPLESIFKKPLHSASQRLQTILLRVIPYSPHVIYRKGTEIKLADTLSRDCENQQNADNEEVIEIHTVDKVTTTTIHKIYTETFKDSKLQKLIQFVLDGWPSCISELPSEIREFWNFRDELTYLNGIIYKSTKILIPKSLQADMLAKIHSGHQGIQRCISRARPVVFWIGMHKDINNFIEKCAICQSYQPSKQKEPLMIKPIPSLPFETVATDIFYFQGKDYLLIADSYSGFLDFAVLEQSTSYEVIKLLKNWFSTHGIPVILESDNGPQFSSKEFSNFTKSWDIQHQTSSPYYPRSNGLGERYVQTAKSILKKCSKDNSDIFLALLNYRNTPRNDELESPNQRLMSRITRSTIPTSNELLKPRVIANVQANMNKLRNTYKENYDNGTKSYQPIQQGDRIRVQRGHRNWVSGTIEDKNTIAPRSFYIRTDDGKLIRRNSIHIQPTKACIPVPQTIVPDIPETTEATDTSLTTTAEKETTEPTLPVIKMSRYGRTIKEPDRYKP